MMENKKSSNEQLVVFVTEIQVYKYFVGPTVLTVVDRLILGC